MPSFSAGEYPGLITDPGAIQEKLFPQYRGPRDVDVVVIGSGIGGGIVADRLADRTGRQVLVLEAGAYLFPTHVYNLSRFDNGAVARNFGVRSFDQPQDGEHHIAELPQLNFGGRSVFWSGLIPAAQPWELHFFPERVRHDLESGGLHEAGIVLNQSSSLGGTARSMVAALRATGLADDFEIVETPRALDQPYLFDDGSPRPDPVRQSSGVFNTAELLLDEVGLAPAGDPGRRLDVLLGHYVETITREGAAYRLVVRDLVAEETVEFTARTVVVAGGSLESPKIVRRSPVFDALPPEARALVGVGLTDHPTTHWVSTTVTEVAGIPVPPDVHAKIIFYSRGRPGHGRALEFPFNVEMNVNPLWWHVRQSDPDDLPSQDGSRVELKFSFGNCLDDGNVIAVDADTYRPQVRFEDIPRSALADARFPALAGWNLDHDGITWVLNQVLDRVLTEFRNGTDRARPDGEAWLRPGESFGHGTVHHAVGTLRMPSRSHRDADFGASVVDENLEVLGHDGLFLCDMSVMPFSSAANPVRTLAALAIRLADHLGA